MNENWAVILGGSSGIGLAAAQNLARDGMNVFVVHRDRRAALARIEDGFRKIAETGCSFKSLNINALDAAGRTEALRILQESLGPDGRVRVLLHSIALGNLRPLRELGEEDFQITIHNMGTSLLSWTQALLSAGLLANDARVIGLTSEGNTFALPNYAAVAAAKAALESLSRAMAVEFAQYGIRTNIIQPGIVDTPALRMIPGHEKMIEAARSRNPFGRLTRPEDVADAISLLCRDEAAWINGALIHVDGGEHVAVPR